VVSWASKTAFDLVAGYCTLSVTMPVAVVVPDVPVTVMV
jgi:hypothetical protein